MTEHLCAEVRKLRGTINELEAENARLLDYLERLDEVVYRAALTVGCTEATSCKCMRNLRDALAALGKEES